MRISKRLIVAVTVLLGIAAIGTAGEGTLPSHRNVLTFSQPIALPGLSLQAGTYTFELADPSASADVVVVMNRERSRVFYLGMTQRVDRPTTMPKDLAVTFGEAKGGAPAPITAWYPIGDSVGHGFIYGTR